MAEFAKMPDPKSVAEVRDRFLKQAIDNIQKSAEKLFKHFTDQQAPQQPLVDKAEWDGDLFNLEDISKVFDRTELEEDFLAVIDKDQPDKGVIGDLMNISTQGDWLATLERAFRSRHSTPIRAWMHAAARRRGQANNGGVIKRGMLDYVERLVKESKNAQQGEE